MIVLDLLSQMGTYLLYGLLLAACGLIYILASALIAETYDDVMDWMDRHG